jgi:hypothetical protein
MKDGDDYLYRLHRLIYCSRATAECMSQMRTAFPQILRVSVRNNAEIEVTGALVACNGWFLQALEGPRIEVMKTYERIGADTRHRDIHLIRAEPIDHRRFASWNMCGRCLEPTDQAIVNTLERGGTFNPLLLTPAMALDLLSAVRDIQRKHSQATATR